MAGGNQALPNPPLLMLARRHAWPVGTRDVRTLPPPSTTAQNAAVGHDTPVRPVLRSICTARQAERSTTSRELMTSPSLSTATHSDTNVHDTAVRFALQSVPGPYFPQSAGTEVGTPIAVQALAPPVGCLVTTAVPELPTATHSEADGHDTADSPGASASWVEVHCPAPPVGRRDVSI